MPIKQCVIEGLFVALIALSGLGCCLYIDDVCTVGTGDIGRCKLITTCSSAIRDLKENKTPTTCGFQNDIPIVCCLDNQTTEQIDTTRNVQMYTTENIITTPIYSTSTYRTTIRTSSPSFTVGNNAGRKSLEKCAEYAKYVYKVTRSPILMMDAVFIKVDTCKFKTSNSFSKRGEFPHLALIGFNSSTGITWRCAGSLISDKFILTSVSCLFSPTLGHATYVRLGEYDKDNHKSNYNPEDIEILEIIKYPKYKARTKSNNIALVKLVKSVRINEYIRPACLSASTVNTNQKMISAGWGTISNVDNSNKYLDKNVLTLIDKNICVMYYSGLRRFKKSVSKVMNFCAKPNYANICVGDLGGPVQIYNADQYCMYSIIGVTNFWENCGAENAPAVYTNISFYIDWIEENVWI